MRAWIVSAFIYVGTVPLVVGQDVAVKAFASRTFRCFFVYLVALVSRVIFLAIEFVRFVSAIVISVAHPLLYDALLSRRTPEHIGRARFLRHCTVLLVRIVTAILETIAHGRHIDAFPVGTYMLHLMALRVTIIILAIQFVRSVVTVEILITSQFARNTFRIISACKFIGRAFDLCYILRATVFFVRIVDAIFETVASFRLWHTFTRTATEFAILNIDALQILAIHENHANGTETGVCRVTQCDAYVRAATIISCHAWMLRYGQRGDCHQFNGFRQWRENWLLHGQRFGAGQIVFGRPIELH